MCRRLLCYGDSNTYGYDPRSYLGERYPESVRWTALLDAGGWKVINQGENGRSIPQRAQEIEAAVQTILCAKAEVVVIMLGSNDLLQCPSLSAESCSGRMERFLASLLAETHTAPQIVLVAPPPMEPGAWVSNPRTIEASRQLAGCYEAVAHRLGIAFADAGAWGVGLTYDGVHFSAEGHLAFAKGMQTALRHFALKESMTS
ncbi:MAG: hypothetical protein K2K53_03035 [Oscillospiraceae bacterium]|nr:hypothetical protein [Oscillospiraceae bacterium]